MNAMLRFPSAFISAAAFFSLCLVAPSHTANGQCNISNAELANSIAGFDPDTRKVILYRIDPNLGIPAEPFATADIPVVFGSTTGAVRIIYPSGIPIVWFPSSGGDGFIRASSFCRIDSDSPLTQTQGPTLQAQVTEADNPLEISNSGTLLCESCDTRFLVFAGSSDATPATPVSLVDFETCAEIDTFESDWIATGVACCDDGTTVLVTLISNTAGGGAEVRRLRIDDSGGTPQLIDEGALSFTGDIDEFTDLRHVVCLPGSQCGMALVAIGNGPTELVSFSLSDMQVADRQSLQGDVGNGIAACCGSDRIYTRSGNRVADDYVECFIYNDQTGEITDDPEFTARPGQVPSSFLLDPLAATRDCQYLLAIEESPPGLRIYDAQTGENLGTAAEPPGGLGQLTSLAILPCCFDVSDPPPPDDDDDDDEDLFVKEIIDGPDRNDDGEIDRAIDVKSRTPSEFTFRITFRQPHLPEGAVCIEDCVPWPWEVVECVSNDPQGDLILVFPAGKYHDEEEDLERRHAPQVVEAQASRPKRRRGKRGLRDTVIQWYPSDNDATLTCTIRTRPKSKSRRKFLPRKCGRLLINKGARAIDTSTSNPLLDADGLPLESNDLFLAAMKDKDGDKRINYTGNGDEDEDGLTDYEECERGTDPCDKDTDGDKVKDGQDPDPLDKNVPGRKRRGGR